MYILRLYGIDIVQSTHQVLVMSTDIRNAFQIALEYDGANGESLVFFSVSSRPITYSLAHITRLHAHSSREYETVATWNQRYDNHIACGDT